MQVAPLTFEDGAAIRRFKKLWIRDAIILCFFFGFVLPFFVPRVPMYAGQTSMTCDMAIFLFVSSVIIFMRSKAMFSKLAQDINQGQKVTEIVEIRLSKPLWQKLAAIFKSIYSYQDAQDKKFYSVGLLVQTHDDTLVKKTVTYLPHSGWIVASAE